VEPPHRVGAEGPGGVPGAVKPQAFRVGNANAEELALTSWVLIRGPRSTRRQLYQTDGAAPGYRGQRATATATPRGRPPVPPSGDTPAPGDAGARLFPDLGRGHRAPPRGVDVKATPADPVRGGPRGRKSPKLGKNDQNPEKWPFLAFFGFLGLLGPFWRIPDPAARGVLHQPLAAGPCTRLLGLLGVLARGGPGRPFWACFWGNPPKWGILAPGAPEGSPAARPGDRAPARGVDVKPPSRTRPDPGSRVPRVPQVPRTPLGVRKRSGGPSGASQGSPAPGRPGRRGLFYINPSRRGPVPGRGPPPGVPKPPLLRRRG